MAMLNNQKVCTITQAEKNNVLKPLNISYLEGQEKSPTPIRERALPI